MGQLTTAAFTAYNPANASTITAGPFSLYSVSLDSLLPTQINEGFTEVDIKAAGFDDTTTLAGVENTLLSYIEPVVIGPGGSLYLLDGHHTLSAVADSVWGAQNPTVYINVVANYSSMSATQFWSTMQTNGLLLPLNNGTPVTIDPNTGAPIPTSLTTLISDPYRGLEYSILKNKSATLYTTTVNLIGAAGATTPGLDKVTGLYSDFIWAQAYQSALGGLGLPYLSPGDIALATQWNLNLSNTLLEPVTTGTTTTMTQVSVGQLPGAILANDIVNAGGISNTTLQNGTLDAFGTFTGLTSFNFNGTTLGTPQSGLVIQDGADLKHTITLNGTNTYTGGTTLIAGTLIIGSDAALGAAAPTSYTIDPTAIAASVRAANGIVFNGLTEGNPIVQFGTASGGGTGTWTTNRPIAVDGEIATLNPNGYVVTLTGQIVSLGTNGVGIGNATGISDLTINDKSTGANGVVVLAPATGSNAQFYGNWIITAGTLRVSSDAALGNTTLAPALLGQIDLNGGILQAGASFTSARSLFLGGGSTYDTNGYTTAWGALSDTQRQQIFSNSSATTLGKVTFASLSVASTATLTLTGITKSGTTQTSAGESVTFTNGITRSGNATLLLASPISASNQSLLGTAGAQVFLGTAPTLTNGIVAPWIINDDGGAATVNPYSFVSYSATNGFTPAAFTKSGNTASTGLGASTGTDIVEETGGTSTTPATTTLAANASAYALRIDDFETVVATGHTITLGNGSGQAGLILSAGNITGGTLAFGSAEAVISQKGTSTVSATLTGTGGLTLQGSGTLSLSNATTITGAISIDSGTLSLAAANSFAGDAVWLSNNKSKPSNAVLNFTASQTFAALNSAGSNSTVSFSNGAVLTIGDTGNQSSTLSAAITETGNPVAGAAIVKAGTGLLDLTGMSSGTLTLATNGTTPNPTIAVQGGQLRVAAKLLAAADAGTIFAVSSGAEVQFAENGGDVFAGAITGQGAMRLLTGTLKLTGTANTYSGGTFVEIGATLDLTTANVSSGNANITDAGGIVVFDQATDGTYAGVISDGKLLGTGPSNPGELIKDDSVAASSGAVDNSGTVTLTQVQTFTGGTFIEAGGIALNAANALATSSGVTLGRIGGGATAWLNLGANQTLAALNSDAGTNTTSVALGGNTLTLDPAAGVASNFAGTIGGTGALVIAGAGTVTLTGANTYSGGTTLQSGTLELGNAAAAGTGAITFGTAGATLMIDSAITPVETIAGFAAGDVLDLAGLAWTSTGGAVLNANGTLTITEGSSVETLTLANPSAYAGDAFHLASDGKGGTAVTLQTPPLPVLSVNGGAAYVNAAGEANVAFSVANLVAGDTGTVTFTDSQGHTTSVAVSAAQTSYSVNFTGFADGVVQAHLAITGNSYGATGNAVTLIATPPAAPSGLADAGVAGGYVNAANDTAAQALTGTAQANATVKVYDNGTALGQTTANDAGAWTYTLGVLADGAHSLTATATDAAGNTSAASGALAFTVDTQAPAAPTGLTDAAVINDVVNIARNGAGQTLIGSAEANATITIYDEGFQAGTTTADATGAWSYALGQLPGGGHSFTATATDAAGNTGTQSQPLTFLVDDQAPYAFGPLSGPTIVNGYVNAANDTAGQVLTGFVEAQFATTVTVYDNGQAIGTTTADPFSGQFSFALGHLADGAHALTVVGTDQFGNVGNTSQTLSFIVDTQAPAAPAALADTALVNGYVNAANDTAAQALTGTAEANAAIAIYDNGTQIGATSANAAGAWSYMLGTLADGAHSLTATATDAAGNTGAASAALAFTVDTQIPAAPSALADAGIVAGFVNAANDAAAQALTGMAQANATVTVYDNGSVLGQTTADGTGAWAYTLGTLADGAHSLTATATDAAGNTGAASSALAFTVDTQAPAAPAGLSDAGIIGGYVNAANDTASQSVTGTAPANATVKVYDNGLFIGQTTADATGAWSVTLGVLPYGTQRVTASATDSIGNVSPPSAVLQFVVDTTIPNPVTISDAAISAGTVNAAHNTAAQALVGFGRGGDTVTVTANGTLFGTTTVAANGTWGLTIGVLADGAYTFAATQTSPAGNTSVAKTLAFTVVGTPPAAPSALADPAISGGIVNAAGDTAAQALTGNAAAGSTVTVYDNGRVLGRTTAIGTGTFSFTLGVLANGAHSLTAIATDRAGNSSAASAALAFTVNATIPAAPNTLTDSAAVGGVVNAARDTAAQAITGRAAAGSLVSVYAGTTLVGTTTTAANGVWGLTLGQLADGNYSLTATAANSAGNVSVASAPLAFAVHTAVPAAPANLADAGIQGGYVNAANDTATQALAGTAAAGSTVTVYDNGRKLGSTVAGGSGAWAYTLGVLANGAHSLTATATDAYGNASTASTALGFTVAATLPKAPSGLAVPGSVNEYVNASLDNAALALTGSAPAGDLVTVYNNNVVAGTAVAQANGQFRVTLGALANGLHYLSATATDIAGNVSAMSSYIRAIANTTFPQVTISNFAWNATTNSLTVGGTQSEGGTTIVLASGTQSVLTSNAGNAWFGSLTISATAPVQARAIATDLSGNKTTVSVFVDAKPNAVFGVNSGAQTVLVLPGDTITAGSGPDTFVMQGNFGKDTISNFATSGSNADVLEFAGGNFADWAHVMGATTQVGNDLKITLDANDVITLKNVSLANFTSANVTFA